MNCCTDLYQHPLTHHLLGDSFHPGGLETTRSLAAQCLVNRTSKVLDIATGRATSAAFLVKQYGAQVLGLDLGMDNLQTAKQTHHSLTKLNLITGDAMQLPFQNNSLDVVFCECALCTFDNRDAAMQEIYRVLKPGGFIAISDIFLNQALPIALETTLNRWLCVAGALSRETSIQKAEQAGFNQIHFEDRSAGILASIDSIKLRFEVLESLTPLNLEVVDSLSLKAEGSIYIRNSLKQLANFVEAGGAGYYTISARKLPRRG
ncbi:Methylase involved in ubiquinone/menaquinone biosynthesis-like protein [Shewanella sediminis HAW-EB3]|uniref:Methylase involved in ubiquinone/menaquinone biosynthesis-like protein n=1 Tax=Shewanella sediminis (strain HAW-EB3) TaxID=425104 RepID=A8G0N1_SHESH|nr:methyltransferase domain-containing protein [Shewanella sediminis]ABV38654.1 Methylase involved in ubiquinone/menaquinone biosynthesis-like protein [Shewanella sediminis HAW-EB3]